MYKMESFSKKSASVYKIINIMHLSSNRVILSLVERQEDRGLVVAQGGGKVRTCFIKQMQCV